MCEPYAVVGREEHRERGWRFHPYVLFVTHDRVCTRGGRGSGERAARTLKLTTVYLLNLRNTWDRNNVSQARPISRG